jgi:hypothetical protein
VTRFKTLAAGLILVVACVRDPEPAARVDAYAYFFYETTGANKFILVDGVEQAIEFDDASNEAAVQALYALRWNVLYPNSDGDITLLGIFHPETHTFSLVHWYLPSAFLVHPPGEEPLDRPPAEWQDTLEQVHFVRELDGDPSNYQVGPDGLLTPAQKSALYEWSVGRLF